MRRLVLFLLLLASTVTAQTTITIDGTDQYTLNDHPRIFLDGSSGTLTADFKDPDGSGGSVAPRATVGDEVFDAMVAVVRPCVSDYLNCSVGSGDGYMVAFAALDWYMDNTQTASLTAAKYWINNVEKLYIIGSHGGLTTEFGCAWGANSCDQASYPDWAALDYIHIAFAYSVIRSELTAGQRTTFSQKMLNVPTMHNGDGGCDDQLELVSGATANYTTGASTITGSGFTGMTNGRIVVVKPKILTTNAGWGIIDTVDNDGQITLTEPLEYYNGGNWGSTSGGIIYELQPWTSSTCGAVYMMMNERNAYYGTFGEQYTTGLAETVAAGATSFDVDDASGFPTAPFVIYTSLGGEYMRVTNVASNTLTVTRGYWGSPDVIHYSTRSVSFRRWYPRGTEGENVTQNKFITKMAGIAAVALALADEDGTAANYWMTHIVQSMANYTMPDIRLQWTGFTNAGNRYQFARTIPNLGKILVMLRDMTVVGGAPSLDLTNGNFWKNIVDATLYLSYPNYSTAGQGSYLDIMGWGQSTLGSPEKWNQHWIGLTQYLYPGSDQAKYLRWWTENTAQFYDQTFLTTNAGYYRMIFDFLLFLRSDDTTTDYRSVYAKTKAFNVVDDPPGQPRGAWVSRSGFTSANDTLIVAESRQQGGSPYSDNTSDHNGFPYTNPGAYRIYKVGYLMTANGVYDIGQDDDTNMLLFGGVHNVKPDGYWLEDWIDRADSDADWGAARINLTNVYVAGANASRALRYLVHLRGGANDYLVVYDDMASSSGNTKSFNLDYDEDCSTFTTALPNVVCRAADRSLLTDVIYPSGSGVAKSTSSLTYAERLTLCASSDGSTCDATNTAADFLLVHMPLAAPTGNMPTVSGLGTIDADFRGVQIEDATMPAVAVFPKVGQEYDGLTFTSSYSGTGANLVMGLEPGIYDVSLTGTGIVANDVSVDGDGTLYWESAAGDIVITQEGQPPPPVILTTSCPNAPVGVAYTCTLTGTCSDTPCDWLRTGNLPTGLSEANEGNTSIQITGTPSGPGGSYPFNYSLTDNSTNSDNQDLSIQVVISVTTKLSGAVPSGVRIE